MKIFVTGGTGFLGRRLIQRLKREGHFVGGLTRGSPDDLLRLGVDEAVPGHLANVSEWSPRLQGYEAVIHCAAPVEFWGPWEKFHQGITIASRDLLQASDRAGVGRFLYVSSESVILDGRPHEGINEDYVGTPVSDYGRAKKLAEAELCRLPTKTAVLIFRPAWIWGEGDSSVPKILEKIRQGSFVWIDGGRTKVETVHVDNVVEALILGLSRGKDRRPYFVTDGEAITMREQLTALFDAYFVTPPRRELPSGLVKLVALILEKGWKLVGSKSPPPLNVAEWAFVSVPRVYDTSRIRSELGYRPVISRAEGWARIKAARSESV